MDARLVSVAAVLSVLHATLVSPASLWCALEAHAHLQPTFAELDRLRRLLQLRRLSGRETKALGRLPDEVWEAVKAELRRSAFVEVEERALEPIRGCRWCRERGEEDGRPDEEERSWQAWLTWAMQPTRDWDIVQESGFECQVCGEAMQELLLEVVAVDYSPLLAPYGLYAHPPASPSDPNEQTYLALSHSSPIPRTRFSALPDFRRPRPTSSILQLDAAHLHPPDEAQLANYGRFFREWPLVEVVRDPLHRERGLADPPWMPRLTVWHETEPELDED
ncbi:hypothetical protein JCM8097_003370 [Rhodosporidiobolus ruineniae]